jgi:hypothetical protein
MIVTGFFALIAAGWLLAAIVAGTAYIQAKYKEKNAIKHLPQREDESSQILVSIDDKSAFNASTNIEPKNPADINSKIEEILELLEENKDNNILLLVFGSMLGLNPDQIISENVSLSDKFKEYCASILDKENFTQITKARIELGEYGASIPEGIAIYYEIYVEEFFDRFKYIFIKFNDYMDLVKSKSNVIASKKRSLVHQDEFGDLDGSLWVDYLQRFAAKMNIVNPHASIAAEFEAANEIFKILNLDNFQGKVLGYIFALNEHLEKKDDPLANVITGIDFELHLKSLLEAALPNVYVETTPASGDHGADLIARYNGITVAIQAKYYTGSVGNGAVQEIHSGMGFYDADFGMVVTQSTYTDHAISLANKLGIYLESVDSFTDKIKMLAK